MKSIRAEARELLRELIAPSRMTEAEARAIAYGRYESSQAPIRSEDHANDYVLANTNGVLLEALVNDDYVMAALVNGDASMFVAERQRVIDETIAAVLRANE